MITTILAAGVVAAAGTAYLIVFGVRLRPEWSIYGYLLLWITVPKAFRFAYLTNGADLPEGVTIFTLLEGFAALTMVIALLAHPGLRRREDKRLRPLLRWMASFAGIATATMLVSFGWLSSLLPTRADGLWQFFAHTAPLQHRVVPFLSVIYALIFIHACVAFITKTSQVEAILLILFASGIELGLETIVFSYFGLNGGIFTHSIQAGPSGGRFNSIVFTAYDTVGVFAIVGLCAGMYFVFSGGGRFLSRPVALTGFVLCWLPALRSYQRSALVAALAALALVYWLAAKRHARLLATIGAVVVVMSIVGAGLGGRVGKALGGAVRPDYFSTESLDGRVGLQNRALDVVDHFKPFGAGPGMVRYAMKYPFEGPRAHDGARLTRTVYRSEQTGTRFTNSHNMLLEFVVQYGLAGILLLVAMGRVIWLAWHARVQWPPPPSLVSSFFAQICGAGMLVGIGLHGQFEATDLPVFLYVLPVFLLARECRSTPTGAEVHLSEKPVRLHAVPASRA